MITSQGFGLIAELIAVPTLVGRRHGGACDTGRGRDDNHQLIYLGSKFVSHDHSAIWLVCSMSTVRLF
jgi:hypothetical protein